MTLPLRAKAINRTYKGAMSADFGHIPQQAARMIPQMISLMESLDSKFANHFFPSGPVITLEQSRKHQAYITKEQAPLLHVLKDAKGEYTTVYMPRRELYETVARQKGSFDAYRADPAKWVVSNTKAIKAELKGLVSEYEKGAAVQPEDRSFREWITRRGLFNKVERVEPGSFWQGLTCDGVKVHYYHGTKNGKMSDMGELKLRCSCADFQKHLMCSDVGSVGLKWKPEPLIAPFDETRVGFERLPGQPSKATPALIRMALQTTGMPGAQRPGPAVTLDAGTAPGTTAQAAQGGAEPMATGEVEEPQPQEAAPAAKANATATSAEAKANATADAANPDMAYVSSYLNRGIALHCIALHCIALHCTALHCTALHCIALHCIALHCSALHCIALHCIALHCIASLHCIALHCIALHYKPPSHHRRITIVPRVRQTPL